MPSLREKLEDLGACDKALEWVGDRDLALAWAECPRADWLLWLAGRMTGQPGWPTHQEVVLAACDCVGAALRYVPMGDPRPRAAIEAARGWVRGEVSLGEVPHAAHAAHAAAAADAYAALEVADAYAALEVAYAAAAAYAALEVAYAAAAAYAALEVADAYAAAFHATNAYIFTSVDAGVREKAPTAFADIVRHQLQPGKIPEVES